MKPRGGEVAREGDRGPSLLVRHGSDKVTHYVTRRHDGRALAIQAAHGSSGSPRRGVLVSTSAVEARSLCCAVRGWDTGCFWARGGPAPGIPSPGP